MRDIIAMKTYVEPRFSVVDGDRDNGNKSKYVTYSETRPYEYMSIVPYTSICKYCFIVMNEFNSFWQFRTA